MEEGKFDGILVTMLQEGKNYETFFDNLFGFLRRKTDFFSDWKKAETIIAGAGKKHIEQYEKDKKEEQRRQEEKAKREEAKAKEKKTEPDQDEIKKMIEKAKLEQERAQREAAEKKAQEAAASAEEKKEGDKDKDEKESKAPPGNGGITDRYIWTQTLNEVTVSIPVDDSVSKKDTDIKITQKGLYVGVKGQKIIDGDWPEKIDVRSGNSRSTILFGLLSEAKATRSSTSRLPNSRLTRDGGTVS